MGMVPTPHGSTHMWAQAHLSRLRQLGPVHSVYDYLLYLELFRVILLWFMDGVDQQVTAAKEANMSIDELEIVSKPTRHPMDLIVVQPP